MCQGQQERIVYVRLHKWRSSTTTTRSPSNGPSPPTRFLASVKQLTRHYVANVVHGTRSSTDYHFPKGCGLCGAQGRWGRVVPDHQPVKIAARPTPDYQPIARGRQ